MSEAPTTAPADTIAATASAVPELVRLTPGTDPTALRESVRALDAAGVRWIVLTDDGTSGVDALVTAAWLGPVTQHAVLIPEVPITHTEPFHAATGTATLDYAAPARGGWSPVVQTTPEAAALAGRRPAAAAAEAWREAVDVDRVVTLLWTSWDADAEIRDQATGRFLDREKVHYVDFSGTDSVGEEFTVKGPSIVPRPPQGELPTLVTADSPEAVRAAAAFADIVLLGEGAGTTAEELRAAAGREITVLPDVPALSAAEAGTLAETLAEAR